MFRPLRRHNVALAASSAQNHHPAAESIAIANDAQQNKLVELAIAVRSAPAVDGVRSVRCDQRYHSPYFSEWTKRIYGLVKPRKKLSAEPIQMMSTKDPLSVPIMFVNFRRFVSCVGLMFWLQDQFEEIVMWKEGWRVTCAWLSAYGFYCMFLLLMGRLVFTRHTD